MDVPPRAAAAAVAARENGPAKAEEGEGQMIPSIHEWCRLAVSSPPAAASSEKEQGTPLVKEAFDPATLSRAAYALLRERLLPTNPTHVLIERQRFRSMGSKHILEWTIRVNMFESILYAVLCTLKAERVWNGEVVGVTPGKVGPFWLGGGEGDGYGSEEALKKVRKTKSAKARNKGLKIDLVRRWLGDGNVVGLGNKGVAETARQYIEKWDRAPGGRKVEKKADGERAENNDEMGKLDDLADCLLQGMAWVNWEENRRIALKYGVEAILEHGT